MNSFTDKGGRTILIEVATTADGDEIADLYLASRADVLGHLKRVHNDEEVRVWIKTVIMQRGGGVVWIARQNGKIVGFLALDGEDLDQLYLLPGTYRNGIGSRLLAQAKAASPGRLHLYTFQCNGPARTFYETHGFRALRFSDGAGNEEQEPDVYYEWSARP